MPKWFIVYFFKILVSLFFSINDDSLDLRTLFHSKGVIDTSLQDRNQTLMQYCFGTVNPCTNVRSKTKTALGKKFS